MATLYTCTYRPLNYFMQLHHMMHSAAAVWTLERRASDSKSASVGHRGHMACLYWYECNLLVPYAVTKVLDGLTRPDVLCARKLWHVCALRWASARSSPPLRHHPSLEPFSSKCARDNARKTATVEISSERHGMTVMPLCARIIREAACARA